MDGENNGKPYFLMDDLGEPLFLETSISYTSSISSDFHQFHFHPTTFIFKDIDLWNG